MQMLVYNYFVSLCKQYENLSFVAHDSVPLSAFQLWESYLSWQGGLWSSYIILESVKYIF